MGDGDDGNLFGMLFRAAFQGYFWFGLIVGGFLGLWMGSNIAKDSEKKHEAEKATLRAELRELQARKKASSVKRAAEPT